MGWGEEEKNGYKDSSSRVCGGQWCSRSSPDLSVFVEDVPEEPEGVWEALRASALPNAHHAVLLRVQDPALKHDRSIQSLLMNKERVSIYSGRKESTTLTCFPMGSGLVTVVLKKPSHSSLP